VEIDRRAGWRMAKVLGAARLDWVNIGLIVACAALARAWPYHVLMAAFCLLGPAHYLTQMSWMADKGHFLSTDGNRRKWFVGSSWAIGIAVGLLAALGADAIEEVAAVGMASAWGCALWACMPATARAPARLAALAGLPLLVGAAVAVGPAWAGAAAVGFFAVAMPTVVHVFLFTAMFMLGGALRSGSKVGLAALVALGIAAASFFAFPLDPRPMVHIEGIGLFSGVAAMLSPLAGGRAGGLDSAVAFLAFAYAYHYLNWFSKTEVIAWHKMPKGRVGLLVAAYAAMIGSYAVSFQVGLALSVLAASLHIFLELPLDARAIMGLWRGR
jgi:hypothetical protein